MAADTKWFEGREPELSCQPSNYLLIADGHPGMWIRRALEREDFRVIDSRVASEEVGVEIVANDSDEESPWRLKMDSEDHYCSDIGSLIAQVATHALNEPDNCPA